MAIEFRLCDNPNHPIVKFIRKYEMEFFNDDSLIVYYPHKSESSGWSIDGCFLGYTIKEVVEKYDKNIQ